MKKIILICTATLSIFITGCALKLQQAQVQIPDNYLYDETVLAQNATLSEQWWTAFGDTTLNRLIESALDNNKDLASSATSLLSARYYLSVARAEFLPALSFDASSEIVHQEQTTTREFSLEPTISWEVSLFGQLRNTKKAAQASLLSTEWNYRGLILSLCVEVATSYFTLLQYARSYQIACQSYELRSQETALVDSLFSYGMSNGIALMQARSLVFSARADMYKYKKATELALLSLNTLLSQSPQKADLDNIYNGLLELSPSLEVPAGLPSSLLERRPDLLEAYYKMEQEAANVGLSRAERYPSISLTGTGGLFSSTLKGLTSGNPLAWSFTGSLFEPIFNFGKLKGKEMMARESYKASLLDYEQAVLTAVSEVEKALVNISTNAEQITQTESLVYANGNITLTTSALYRSGMGDYQSVIDAERDLFSSQIELIELKAQQYINYVNLYKALGGGW